MRTGGNPQVASQSLAAHSALCTVSYTAWLPVRGHPAPGWRGTRGKGTGSAGFGMLSTEHVIGKQNPPRESIKTMIRKLAFAP